MSMETENLSVFLIISCLPMNSDNIRHNALQNHLVARQIKVTITFANSARKGIIF